MSVSFHRRSFVTTTASKHKQHLFPRASFLRQPVHPFRLRNSGNEPVIGEASDESLPRLDQALLEVQSTSQTKQETLALLSHHPFVLFLRKMTSGLLKLLIAATVVYLLNQDLHWMRYLASMVFPTLIVLYSLQKGSLSSSGALAAWFVGFGTFLSGLRCTAILLSFFISSSALTKFKDNIKSSITADHKKGGQRDWIQVFSNGFFATIFCLIYAYITGLQDSPLGGRLNSSLSVFVFGCVLGNYSCTCGDTWASELGVLSKSQTRLITNLSPVHRGTNGGVTPLGLLASLGGGLFVGLACFLATILSAIGQPISQVIQIAGSEWPVVGLGMIGGLVGSLLDSVLGAIFQFSGFDHRLQKVVNRPSTDPESVYKISGIDLLSNNQVNLISSLIMSLVVGGLTLLVFG